MNLDLLESSDKNPEKVSTGKKEIQYDKTKADLSQQVSEHLLSKPYIVRAIEYVERYGFQICKHLKEAIEGRNIGKKFLTIHEADIVLRNKIDLANQMLEYSLFKFGGFLCEDNSFLSGGVFELRARWNKGVEWRNTKRASNNESKRLVGDNMLLDIESSLNKLGFPLHAEEIQEGFDKEFLKPEYMTWDMFNIAIGSAMNRSIQEKDNFKNTGMYNS